MILNKKIKKGQSLIYVLIILLILISSVYFVYDTGKLVNTKIQFQNGADAAALAGTAVKISKHHTDTLMRTAMFNEALAAQIELKAAHMQLLGIILNAKEINRTPVDIPVTLPGQPTQPKPPIPGVPKSTTKAYKNYVNKTYRHVIKLHRERKALEAYYFWLSGAFGINTDGEGRNAVTEAARIAFRNNIHKLISIKNLSILSKTNHLAENNSSSNDRLLNIGGGVSILNEGTRRTASFGKTYVEFDGQGIPSSEGAVLLKYFKKYLMTTNAMARVTSSQELGRENNTIADLTNSKIDNPLDYEMIWYSPTLMAIEANTSDKNKSLH